MLLNTVKDNKACKVAHYKPEKGIEGAIADLHFFLAALPTISKTTVIAHYLNKKSKKRSKKEI